MRSFKSFFNSMSKLRQLRALSSSQRDQLLKELYEAAKERQSEQDYAEDVAKKGLENRRYGERFADLLPKLKNILKSIKEVRKRDGALILDIETEYMGHLSKRFGTLEEATKHLEALIQTAKDLEGLGAFLVHPKARKDPEKKLVTERSKVIRIYTDSSDKHSRHLPGGKFIDLDHRLKRKASKILAKFQKATGAKIWSHDFVTSKIFELALGRDSITPGNVHAEVARMKKSMARKKNVTASAIEPEKAAIRSSGTESH
jgi:hypothetical protein